VKSKGKYFGGYREYNLNWKGGKVLWEGYYYIYKPEHPFSNATGYIAEHRIIWEEHHKACLLPWSHVHHKNGIKTDNKIENLTAMTKRDHRSHHNRESKTIDMNNRFCQLCKSKTTMMRNRKGEERNRGEGMRAVRPHWYKHEDGFICRKCYYHLLWEKKEKVIEP
jgi:hypothetical protein